MLNSCSTPSSSSRVMTSSFSPTRDLLAKCATCPADSIAGHTEDNTRVERVSTRAGVCAHVRTRRRCRAARRMAFAMVVLSTEEGRDAARAPARAFGRRIVLIAVAMCAALVPLLPMNEMKVHGTFAAGFVLLAGVCASLWSGERLRSTVFDAPVLTFFGAAIASTIFGVNPRISLIPSPSRGEGLLDYFVFLPTAL